MRFPPEFIDRIKNSLSVSQVLSKRIAIKKHGREFHALCPFHKEQTPSFTINDEKNFYHCFGCGAHGDAITFLIEYERLSYPEAVERLAAEAGMQVPAPTAEAQAAYKRQSGLQEVCEAAAAWFGKQLHTQEGQIATAYLRGRGTQDAMIAQFRIGYSPQSRDALKQALLKKGIDEKQMLEAGLIIQPDNGATYDRFRGRLMFPICDARGRVVAFGGRSLASGDANAGPKYLNSPETPLFKKGEMLYGMHVARRAITEQNSVLITEGYMDVIALHQAGIAHAVAPLGTAITSSHLELLWRIAPEPVLCLDGDAAGQRAMMRAAELALPLIRAGVGLKFAILPAGEDPDSLIIKRGAGAMRGIIANARTLSETLWQTHATALGTATPEQRAMVDSKLKQLSEQIPDRTLRQHMRDYFYKQLRSLDATPAVVRNGMKNKPVVKRVGAVPHRTSPAVAALAAQETTGLSLKRLEEQLVAILLLAPNLLQKADIEEEFARIVFADPLLDNIRLATLEHLSVSDQVDRLSLNEWLSNRGLSESVSILLHHADLPKSMQSDASLSSIESAWRQVMGAYHRAHQDMERKRTLSDVKAWSDTERLTMLGREKDLSRTVSHYILPEE